MVPLATPHQAQDTRAASAQARCCRGACELLQKNVLRSLRSVSAVQPDGDVPVPAILEQPGGGNAQHTCK